ncbi:MAG: transposase-like protein [Ulvibacter sp.]|jgi:transposase-like protein|tara:strand:- start:296 stop:583 length:288 start_codon:yes stop_codon:yes gene_type:complete
MSKVKQNYSSSFKLKVVLKYISNDSTISEICQEFGISKPTLHKWVSKLKSSSDLVFNQKASGNNKKEYDKKIESLNGQIGELFVENSFLKKVLDA